MSLRSPDVHATIGASLSANGQRYTATRRGLVDILVQAHRPLTLPEILEHATGLAQSSAYRNLADLTDLGIVRRVSGADDHGRFELAEAITGHHHHHLICDRCGLVTDFVVPDDLEAAIDQAAERLGTTTGFVVAHHQLDLIGRCAGCT